MSKKIMIPIIITIVMISGFFIGMKILDSYLAEYELKDFKNVINLSQDEMLTDYTLFWAYIRNELPFAADALEKRGIDVSKLEADYRANITTDMEYEAFLRLMFELQAEFRNIAHLQIVGLDELDTRNSNPDVVRDNSVFRTERFAEFYSFINRYNITQKASVLPRIKTPNVSRLNISMDCFTDYIDDKTAYLRLNTFKGLLVPFEDNTLWRQRYRTLLEFYASLASYDNLILDIRNNQGGADEWLDCVVNPLTSEDLTYTSYACYSQGENSTAQEDSPELMAAASIKDKKFLQSKPFFEESVSAFDESAFQIVMQKYDIKANTTGTAFAGKIYLLVNEETFSAADTFANFCKTTGFAELVGTPSGGNGVYAYPFKQNIMHFQLPASGITYQYYPWMGLNNDGSSNAAFGDTPDYDTEDDAYTYCMKLIEDAQARHENPMLPDDVSSEINGVTVRVDPAIELLSVIQYLSDYDKEYGLISNVKSSYTRDIDKYFKKFKQHETVEYFNRVMKQGFSFDSPPTACLYLEKNFELQDDFEGSDYQNNRLSVSMTDFRDKMKLFFADSDFGSFFNDHKEYYDNIIKLYTDSFPEWDMTGAMESYYNKNMEGYNIILASLFHPGGYGPGVERSDGTHIYSIIGPQSSVDSLPFFGDEDSISSLVLHEFGHSFIDINNPDNELMAAEVKKSEYLYENIQETMSRMAYTSWSGAYEEHVLRAATIDLMMKNSTLNLEQMFRYERSQGFKYIEAAYTVLAEYSENRDKYPTFDDFVPIITDALMNEYPK